MGATTKSRTLNMCQLGMYWTEHSFQAAMRRAGHNPTDIQVLDILNSIDDESGYLDFQVSVGLDTI